MPKAKPYPDSEDDKTAVESQWEEEASTTVEEGDVAARIRSLQTRGNDTGVGQDEPTVDDEKAHLSAITPLRDVARLVITQGNDVGQETEVRPGKTYTIGRAIENDFVLTDIAVSRKHFDLRFEDGAWLIVDRGSGNGTVVNGNLEDNPFMLANSDVIEIGNTVFRFEQPNGAERSQQRAFDSDDDEEMSTVAGKPMRKDIAEIVEPRPQPATRPPRPKTLPPPTPLRAANASAPPPFNVPMQPASTLPLPQMANRPPLAAPGMPTMLGDSSRNLPAMLPTTIPGQGVGPPRQRPMYPYPQATEIPPHSVHAQMMLIQTQNRRGDASTAHVQPMHYEVVPARGYGPPQISKRAKLVLAAVGLAVFAAVATIAIIKSSTKPKHALASTGSAEKMKADGKRDTKVARPRTAAVIPPPKIEPPAPAKVESPPPKVESPPPKVESPPKVEAPPTKVEPPPVKVEAPPTKVEPPPTKIEPPAVAKNDPAKTTPAPAKPPITTPPPKNDTKVVRPDKRDRRERREARREVPAVPVATPPRPEPEKRSGGADTSAAESKASSLYRQKRFSDAAQVLSSAANKADEDKARELRRTADMYSKLSATYFKGMAPGGSPKEAFEALRSASNYDRNLDNAFDAEIQSKLSLVAPKAAIQYMGSRNYTSARDAVKVAEQFGASEGVKVVRLKLESVASELYNDASRELESNPTHAKDMLRQIKSIVDQKSTWWQKADKLLRGG